MAAKSQSISELRRELKTKKRQLTKLRARRANLARRLAAADKEIAAVVGRAGPVVRRKKKARKKAAKKKAGRKVRRARKRATGKPLVQYIQSALSKAPGGMRVKALVGAVRQAGYKSSSKDFYGIVAKTLLTNKQFQRVGRGVYKLGS